MLLVYPDIASMKAAVEAKMATINVEEIRSPIDQFPKRVEACLLAEGGHFNSDQLISQETLAAQEAVD